MNLTAPAFFSNNNSNNNSSSNSSSNLEMQVFETLRVRASDFSNLHISQQQPHGRVLDGGAHGPFLQQQNAAPGLAPATSIASYSQVSMYNTSSMQQPMQLQQQQQQQTVLSKQQK